MNRALAIPTSIRYFLSLMVAPNSKMLFWVFLMKMKNNRKLQYKLQEFIIDL